MLFFNKTINFDGRNGSIRKQFNVSSVARNAVGDYTITFSTAMPDTNYILTGIATGHASFSAFQAVNIIGLRTTAGNPDLKSTSQVRILKSDNGGDVGYDSTNVYILVFD
jgi:hypothetical protein